jgi:hypothetical protein
MANEEAELAGETDSSFGTIDGPRRAQTAGTSSPYFTSLTTLPLNAAPAAANPA